MGKMTNQQRQSTEGRQVKFPKAVSKVPC